MSVETSRRRTKRRRNRLSLGWKTFTKNLKRFGWILIAVEPYAFDHFLGDFWSFL